jgi:hypothetical protein
VNDRVRPHRLIKGSTALLERPQKGGLSVSIVPIGELRILHQTA